MKRLRIVFALSTLVLPMCAIGVEPSLQSLQEPIVEPAARTRQPINEIRKILYQIPFIDAERATLGLSPVINLSVGQPHIAFQKKTIDSFIDYLESLKEMPSEQLSREMGYSHSSGVRETKEWISRFFSSCYPEVEEGFAPDEVMVTNGATGALSNVLKVIIQEGDEVAIFAPFFSGYVNQIKNCGGRVFAVPFVAGRSRPNLLNEALQTNPRVKLFIWCDPNNPSGSKADTAELLELAEVLRGYPNLLIAHDEVYKDIVVEKGAPSLLNIAPDLKPRSFVIRSLSKDILGAPGIRAGMISAPTHLLTPDGSRVNLIELMSNEQLREMSGISVFTQKMLVIALQQKMSGDSQEWEDSMRQEYRENVQMAVDALKNAGLQPLMTPKGTFYLMMDATPLLGKKIPAKIGPILGLHDKIGKKILNDIHVAAFFLHAAGVAVVPGTGFGADRCCFRISCANSKASLLEAAQRIKTAIQNLSNE